MRNSGKNQGFGGMLLEPRFITYRMILGKSCKCSGVSLFSFVQWWKIQWEIIDEGTVGPFWGPPFVVTVVLFLSEGLQGSDSSQSRDAPWMGGIAPPSWRESVRERNHWKKFLGSAGPAFLKLLLLPWFCHYLHSLCTIIDMIVSFNSTHLFT